MSAKRFNRIYSSMYQNQNVFCTIIILCQSVERESIRPE